MTGHQPEMIHPGVWAKYFAMQRIARAAGATAIDVVVDSDAFDSLGVSVPCRDAILSRCRHELVAGTADVSLGCTPPPPETQVDTFCERVNASLGTLPELALTRPFSRFAELLHEAVRAADNVAEAITIARRRYEETAGTDYLELPVSVMASRPAFATFAGDIVCNAVEFSSAYNGALADYRRMYGVRSAAQPFPDLAEHDGMVELPFWVLTPGGRGTLAVGRDGDGMLLTCCEGIRRIPRDTEAIAHLLAEECAVAPKALALTLFLRTFVADLFIHGTGGGAYDRVTDMVMKRYYGIEPLPYVVVSATMRLPLEAADVSDEDVATAKDRLNRLDHNPDALLGEVQFDSPARAEAAKALALRKSELVRLIAEPGADKKQIGGEIRRVNAELSSVVEPLRERLSRELAEVEAMRAEEDVRTDRTYPFFLWDPCEMVDLLA